MSIASNFPRAQRKYDVIVWGATGYTGTLVANYLARHPDAPVWAIAGRNAAKLAALKSELVKLNPALASSLDVIAVWDSSDPGEMDGMVSETRCIITLVGPYFAYGKALVASCVRCNTDYVDLTGEVDFMHDMAAQFHDAARDAGGPMIVSACGLDALPSDIGAFMVYDYARRQYGPTATVGNVKYTIYKMRGGISGGTFDTLRKQGQRYGLFSGRWIMHPYVLCPPSAVAELADNPDFTPSWYFDRDFNKPQGASPLAFANERVARRSGALLNYGPRFRFRETMTFRNTVAAAIFTIGFSLFSKLIYVAPIRWIIGRFFPAPGQGPSHDALVNGWYEARIVGEVYTDGSDSTEPPKIVRGRIVIESDPGYLGTSKMIVEAGLGLALNRATTEGVLNGSGGGVMPPAAALGRVMVDRLRRAGFSMEVGEHLRW